MLVMTKKKSNLMDSVDYQNAESKMKFLSVSRTLAINVL